jgi:serine/threonine protein kinase
MNDEGCFGLVDWGLSTKHADNQYLTQYMFTYLYRPPEVFYYGLPLYERQPSWKTIESYDRRHYIESARAPDVISPSIMYTKKNILNGPENPFPYSSESDVYSLGMSFITILLGQFPFKTNNRLSFHYREKLVMRKLFKWRKMVPQVNTSPELDDIVDDDDDLHSLSF